MGSIVIKMRLSAISQSAHWSSLFLAFSIVSDSYNLDKASSSDEGEDFLSDEPATPNNSIMSNMMHGLYTNQSSIKKIVPPKPQSNEPIDISSGDENEDDASRSPKNCGPGGASSAPDDNVPKTLKRPSDGYLSVAVVPPKKGQYNTTCNVNNKTSCIGS